MAAFISRRGLLSLALAGAAGSAAFAAAWSRAGEDSSATVDEKDPLAVALAYVNDAKRVDTAATPNYQPGSSCSGCSWYQGKPQDPAGACTFFPGKQVQAQGWCKMWSKKQ